MLSRKCLRCNKDFNYPPSRKNSKFCSLICSNKMTPESVSRFKEKLSKAHTGMKRSPETCKNISESHKGSKNPSWKGGISPYRKTMYFSKEYQLWRTSVFERDDYTCVWCGTKGGTVHADHIKPWALFPELRLAIDNGRTLCVSCHRTTETYGHQKMYSKKT